MWKLKIITQPTIWVLRRSVFFLWSSFLFEVSSSSSSLALNIEESKQKHRSVKGKLQGLIWAMLRPLVRPFHLCNSRASELLSSWAVAWKASSFSACRALTLLSSSRQRSLLSIIFTYSSLLFSNSARVASKLSYIKELNFNQKRKKKDWRMTENYKGTPETHLGFFMVLLCSVQFL